VSDTVVEWTSVPLVPVIVSVTVPADAVPGAATVRVVEPEPVTEAGLNFPAAPVGRPATSNVTLPANPFNAEIVTV